MNTDNDVKALSTLKLLGEHIKDLVRHIDAIQDDNELLKDRIMKYKRYMRLNRYLLIINGVLCGYAMTHILS